jgi:hypothetical protein
MENNKILMYKEFVKINEEFIDTPESYIETALNQIKRKIEKMFEVDEVDTEDNETISLASAKINHKKKDKNKMSFKDLGLNLESSELSKYSQMYDSVTFKFSDDTSMYNLYITIDLKDGIPTDKEGNFSFEDIKQCFVKFKKYNIDSFDVIGQISKNVDIADIDDEFLVDLKIELDDKFDDDSEKLEIETE